MKSNSIKKRAHHKIGFKVCNGVDNFALLFLFDLVFILFFLYIFLVFVGYS